MSNIERYSGIMQSGAVLEGVEPRWKAEDVSFPFPRPSDYRLKFGRRPIDLTILNPYSMRPQHIAIIPAKAYV